MATKIVKIIITYLFRVNKINNYEIFNNIIKEYIGTILLIFEHKSTDEKSFPRHPDGRLCVAGLPI